MCLYLFTLEIVPLEVGKMYDDLPSHLTLMSRFTSELTPNELTQTVTPLFADTKPVTVTFGSTIELGPKKVVAHMVDSNDEAVLHEKLRSLLAENGVSFQYPEFIGANHKAHVTQREGVHFEQGSQLTCSAAYLIEVVQGRRLVRQLFALQPGND